MLVGIANPSAVLKKNHCRLILLLFFKPIRFQELGTVQNLPHNVMLGNRLRVIYVNIHKKFGRKLL